MSCSGSTAHASENTPDINYANYLKNDKKGRIFKPI